MAARAVGLATTGASLSLVASHATTSAKPVSVAASAYHPPRGLLSIAASANRPPNLQGGCNTRCNFYHQAHFLLNPSRFLLNPALTELNGVAADDGAPVDDGSPMGTALALTAANSSPGECLSVARYRCAHSSSRSGSRGRGGGAERDGRGQRGCEPGGSHTRAVCASNGHTATSTPRARPGCRLTSGGHLSVADGEHAPGQTSSGDPGGLGRPRGLGRDGPASGSRPLRHRRLRLG